MNVIAGTVLKNHPEKHSSLKRENRPREIVLPSECSFFFQDNYSACEKSYLFEHTNSREGQLVFCVYKWSRWARNVARILSASLCLLRISNQSVRAHNKTLFKQWIMMSASASQLRLDKQAWHYQQKKAKSTAWKSQNKRVQGGPKHRNVNMHWSGQKAFERFVLNKMFIFKNYQDCLGNELK